LPRRKDRQRRLKTLSNPYQTRSSPYPLSSRTETNFTIETQSSASALVLDLPSLPLAPLRLSIFGCSSDREDSPTPEVHILPGPTGIPAEKRKLICRFLEVKRTEESRRKGRREGEGRGRRRSASARSFEGSRAHSPEDENGRFGHRRGSVAVVVVVARS